MALEKETSLYRLHFILHPLYSLPVISRWKFCRDLTERPAGRPLHIPDIAMQALAVRRTWRVGPAPSPTSRQECPSPGLVPASPPARPALRPPWMPSARPAARAMDGGPAPRRSCDRFPHRVQL